MILVWLRLRVEWCACFVSWCANECGYIDTGVTPKFACAVLAPNGSRIGDFGRNGTTSHAPAT